MHVKSTPEILELQTLELNQIKPNPDQPRRGIEPYKLKELAASIKEIGLLSPILVRPNGKKFEIVHGERRFQACKKLKLKTIRAEIRELDDREAFLIAFTENLQRENLDPIEEAQALSRLINDFGHTQDQAGEVLGKSQQYVADRLSLLRLPEPIQDMITARAVSPSVGRMLARHDDPQEAEELAMEVADGNLTVRDLSLILKGEPPESENKYLEALHKRYKALTRDDWFTNQFKQMVEGNIGMPIEMFICFLDLAELDWVTLGPVGLEIAETMKDATEKEWSDDTGKKWEVLGAGLAHLYRCFEPMGLTPDDKQRCYLMKEKYEGMPWIRIAESVIS